MSGAVSLAAVLFDMDGLLIDSEPQWLAAETATVEELGGTWGPQQNLDLHGTNLPVAAEYMIRHAESTRTVGEVMEILRVNFTHQLSCGVTFQPGAAELLGWLLELGIPAGLVTSSIREHTDIVLEQLPTGAFAVSVTADDVEHLKPHPMPYLAALAALSVPGDATVVLEDSPPGVQAAEAAGCHVVAVPTSSPIAPGPRRTVVDSLTQLTAARLQEIVKSNGAPLASKWPYGRRS